MGNQVNIPTSSRLAQLEADLDHHCDAAAAALAAADIIAVHAGAGMSADSGLATYATAAGGEYKAICSPDALHARPAAFHAFWFRSVVEYAAATPHAGYAVLARWRTAAEAGAEAGRPRPFFVVTSNVDGLFHASGAGDPSCVRELHGAVRRWQCSVPCADSGVWDVGVEAAAEAAEAAAGGRDAEAAVCAACGMRVRPAVKMFGDDAWVDDDESAEAAHAWWEDVEEWLDGDPERKVVVLEIGVGVNVAILRHFSEHVAEGHPDQVTILRINPEFPLADSPRLAAAGSVIPLAGTAIDVLARLDARLPGA